MHEFYQQSNSDEDQAIMSELYTNDDDVTAHTFVNEQLKDAAGYKQCPSEILHLSVPNL